MLPTVYIPAPTDTDDTSRFGTQLDGRFVDVEDPLRFIEYVDGSEFRYVCSEISKPFSDFALLDHGSRSRNSFWHSYSDSGVPTLECLYEENENYDTNI